MDIYTYPKRSRLKKSNQELSNYHRQNQKIISHLWTPNAHHIRQINQKDPIAPQDHPKDTISPSYGQTPPKYGSSHGILLCQWDPLPTQKIRENIFQVSPSMQQHRKILNHIRIKSNDDQI